MGNFPLPYEYEWVLRGNLQISPAVAVIDLVEAGLLPDENDEWGLGLRMEVGADRRLIGVALSPRRGNTVRARLLEVETRRWAKVLTGLGSHLLGTVQAFGRNRSDVKRIVCTGDGLVKVERASFKWPDGVRVIGA